MWEWLIENGIKLVIGLVVGAAIGALTYKVYEKITLSNLPQMIRNALQNSQKDAVKKLLGKRLTAVVKGKDVNVVKLDVFAEGSSEKVDLTLEGSGVSDNIRSGMKISVI